MADPIPVRPGEKSTAIAAPKSSLASMLASGMTADDIRRNAPESHRQMDRRMGIKTEEEARALASGGLNSPLPPAPKKVAPTKTQPPRWQRGDQAIHAKHGRVTILAARESVSDDGIPYHRVAAGGKKWLVRETNLTPISKK